MSGLDNDGHALLDELTALETELHKNDTRRNRKRMETLLHPDFVEFGRSGTRYTRADVLQEFGADDALPAIHAGNFDLVVLREGAALLTYVSAHIDANGNLHRHTFRSSVWVRTAVGWQIRFHQGTPTSPSSISNKALTD